jgi:hypothetical protein
VEDDRTEASMGATFTVTPTVPASSSATAISTTLLRVALYGRISTRDREHDPQLQLVPVREYAAARGWEITEYVDHASAGDPAGRTAWGIVKFSRR